MRIVRNDETRQELHIMTVHHTAYKQLRKRLEKRGAYGIINHGATFLHPGYVNVSYIIEK